MAWIEYKLGRENEVSGEKGKCYLKGKWHVGRQDLLCTVVWHLGAKHLSQDGCHNAKFRGAEETSWTSSCLKTCFLLWSRKRSSDGELRGQGWATGGGAAEAPATADGSSHSPAGAKNQVCAGTNLQSDVTRDCLPPPGDSTQIHPRLGLSGGVWQKTWAQGHWGPVSCKFLILWSRPRRVESNQVGKRRPKEQT